CPGNSHYNPYTSACPATCFNPMAPSNCSKPCVEGCECNTGFVLSGEQCVPISDCGCLHQGKYYKKDETFWQTDCKGKCTCAENGTVICSNETCEADHICKVQKGTLGCYPPDTATCHIYGDPHYVTFDGRLYHFQGGCNYTIVQPCANSSEPFSVTTRNEHRGSPAWTALNSVSVTLKNVHVAVRKNKEVQHWQAGVNGIQVALPVSLPPGISVALQGAYVVVDTPIGIQVKFDGDHEIFVRADERLRGQLCGLCGTYTENQLDDFLKPDHRLEQDSTKFGDTPALPLPHSFPRPEGLSLPPPPCPCPLEYEELCKIIVVSSGPFVSCHWPTPPQQYFESCVYDLCATGGDMEQFCKILGAYAAACELGGVTPALRCPPSHSPANLDAFMCLEGRLLSPSSINSQLVSPGLCWSRSCPCRVGARGPSMPQGTCKSYLPLHPAHASKIYMQLIHMSFFQGRAICSASGDPHYNTFDQKVHHFMGTCTYTLSKVCNASTGLLPFAVSATNEHRGSNTKVSYVKSVHVEVYDNQISLLKNRKVNVNGRRVNLPVFVGSKIKILSIGGYILLETDFGLRVRFDGNHYAEVSVPSNYQGQLCGLCGNYNNNPGDDNIKPDGYAARDSTELGDSWIVPEDNTCGSSASLIFSFWASSLTHPGVFKDCHAKVNWENFFSNCIYDMCHTGGQAMSLCYGLQAYAEACSSAGICIKWRNATLCPISCPAHSQYDSCNTMCPLTCSTPSAPSSCSSPPMEGCFCSEGYLLSGDKCVPRESCGCIDADKKYHQASFPSWFTRENCTERCTCNIHSDITCAAWKCGIKENCNIQDGVLGCHASGSASCQVVGDPHYFTFDKAMLTFLGTCTYTLVETCNSNSVVPVTIRGKNEDRGQRGATYLKEVYIDVYDNRITLQKSRSILVRGGAFSVLRTASMHWLIQGKELPCLTEECVHASSIPMAVCGMCGNYNGRKEDELLMPNHLQASNVAQFGNSWKPNPPCTAGARPNIEKQCRALMSDPFKQCHHLVDPELFIKTCVYDMCKYGGMKSTLCAIVQAYVDTCKKNGESITWRNNTFCPLPCPSHSHYTPCAPLCPATCNDIFGPTLCEKPGECTEGCVCNNGYVLSNDRCVPLRDCGCRDNKDNYYSVSGFGPKRLPGFAKCRCRKENVITSCYYTNQSSASNERTGLCTQTDYGHCSLVGFGKCLVTGDPHYLTFDGLWHHFQGKSTYVLAQTIPEVPTYLLPFSIEGKNQLMPLNRRITFLKEVRVNVYNHTVMFKQKKKLVVDGVSAIPPARPHEGIQIFQRATRIYMQTDFGLSISYDGSENLVEGLCGNFDNKYRNDFTKPDGSRVRNVNVFGESWKVPVERSAHRLRYILYMHRAKAAPQCPPNSKYSICTSACPVSCGNLAAASECDLPCVEGCECLPGYILSGFDCVPYKECGCTFLNQYYKVGGDRSPTSVWHQWPLQIILASA
uniref:VWFD domain-containing protein n=1 Tax=Crocodylus porosus TaxID=8502 RepID=A0A7M4F1K5_CROPO